MAILLIAGIAAIGIAQLKNTRSAIKGLQSATAFRTDLIETISATGSIKAQTGAEVNIGSDVTGVIKHLYADVGSQVKAGEIIAELDVPDLEAQTRQQKDLLDQTSQHIAELTAGASMQSVQSKDAVDNAAAALQSARVKRDQAAVALRSQQIQTASDIAKAESSLSAAKMAQAQAQKALSLDTDMAKSTLNADLANARNDAANIMRKQTLYAKGYVAASDLDLAQAQNDAAYAQVASDRQHVNLVESTDSTAIATQAEEVKQAQASLVAARNESLQDSLRRQDLQDADIAVRQAEAQLKSATAGLMQNDVLARQVEEARTGVNIQRDALSTSQALLRKAYIRTSITGTVLTMAAQQGETLVAGFSAAPVITVADLTRLEVDAAVDETDIGKVTVGQPALVTVDAFPDTPFHGRVTKIASGSTMQQNVVTYDVTVSIDDPQHRLKPDMTATVIITVKAYDHTLVVPNEAIKPDNMDTVVYVVTAGDATPKKRKVTVGASDDTNSEIVSGLSDGERVVLTGWPPRTEQVSGNGSGN